MSQKAVALAEKYGGNMFATVGLHPNDNKKEVFDYEAYKTLALSSDRVVAIGECGLDYFRGADEAEKARQKDIFIKQIELAKEIKKPLMMHCREAFSDLIEVLKENEGGVGGVIHFFSGSIEDVKALLDMGFYFS